MNAPKEAGQGFCFYGRHHRLHSRERRPMPTTHRLILIPARRGRHVPILDDKGITDSREAILSGPTGAPVREAARELLHRGVARPDDVLEGRHSGTLSVSFRLPVGKAAGG